MRAASAVADRVYARLFAGELVAGETGAPLARRVRQLMLEEGADDPGWSMVVSGRGGYDRLLASPRERVLERGELIWLDIARASSTATGPTTRAPASSAPSRRRSSWSCRSA